MPAEKTTECIAKAIREIKTGRWLPGSTVPSVRSLAGHWHVSRDTVQKVFKTLVRDGYIVREAGAKQFRIPGTGATDMADPESPRHTEIANDLRKRIMQHRPERTERHFSVHTVQQEYRCSYYTARKATMQLCREGFFTRDGRRLIAATKTRVKNAHVHCVTVQSALTAPFYSKVIQQVERSLVEGQWERLQFVFNNSQLPRKHETAGLIILHSRGSVHERIPADMPVVRIQSSSQKTVPARNPKQFHVRTDEHYAGKDTARHLYLLGHRKIAFLSHMPLSTDWVGARLAGLREIYKRIDNTGETCISVYAPQTATKNAGPHGFRTAAMQVITKAVGIESWRELIPADVVRRMYITPITKMAMLVNHAASAQHLFEEALENTDITAWVCANDDLAVAAWQFLRKHTDSGDGDLSTLGFDNSPPAQIHGIASYDFYPDMLGHMAVQCLRTPQRMLRAYGSEISVRGAVIPRASLSRARTNP